MTEGPDYGIQVAWCEGEGDLAEAKRQLREVVVKSMGERRTGEVLFVTEPAGAEALAKIEKLREPEPGVFCDEAMASELRSLRGFLREYGGYLVIAMAEGRPA